MTLKIRGLSSILLGLFLFTSCSEFPQAPDHILVELEQRCNDIAQDVDGSIMVCDNCSQPAIQFLFKGDIMKKYCKSHRQRKADDSIAKLIR